VHLSFAKEFGLGWRGDDSAAGQVIRRDEQLGARLSPPGSRPDIPRELVMGLDFGTSSTKVVIADRSLRGAYAVPFCRTVGVAAYLLPSVLFEDPTGHYSLTGPGNRHEDLKLAMLANPTDERACARVCAFLALTIRSARAWLFETRQDQFARADILWALAIGQPAAQAASSLTRQWFTHLGEVAWTLAGRDAPVSVHSALDVWRRRKWLALGDELEVRPLAELSAQIHGFVSSSHFDARERNFYLLVDVGAGTVDASLFNVSRQSVGSASFLLFTHEVQPFGAANLNRFRVRWWQDQLYPEALRQLETQPELGQRIEGLIDGLESLYRPTEYRGQYPETYTGYVKGVVPTFAGGAKSPDFTFEREVRNQIAGRVLYGAWKRGLLAQEDIRNMPFFLCGGGGRHPFYSSLRSTLKETPGCTWLSTVPRDLVLPRNLEAPGVPNGDYDRLSVAYGLSQLERASFSEAKELTSQIPSEPMRDWGVPITDKSSC